MPETKINVRSPFIKKYQDPDLLSVGIEIYIYSGTKTSDKGTPKYKIKKFPVGNNDYVLVDYSELIRDYTTPTSTTPLNSNKDYIKWVQIEEVIEKEYVPNCSDITGFAVAQDGTITAPISSVIDIAKREYVNPDYAGSETLPPSWNANTTGSPITRTVNVYINVPSGFSGHQSEQKICVLTADQPSS